METDIHFLLYNAHFLKWEMFQGKILDKIKTYFMFNFFFSKIVLFMWKNIVGPDKATDGI